MSNPFTDCEQAIRDVFNTHWTASDTILVMWSDEWAATDIAPTHNQWINVQILYTDETVRAFGGGRFDNERLLSGVVIVSAYAKVGKGEDALLPLFDDVVKVFRSRRVGNLSFSSSATMLDTPPRIGIWRGRSAMIPFEWRFRG